MDLIALGWIHSPSYCTEPITYSLEFQAGGAAPGIFSYSGSFVTV